MAGIFEMLGLCKGEGSEVRGGEQLTSVSLLVKELLTFFYPFFFFHVPNSELTGKRLTAFLNAPNVYNFLCREPGLENKNRRVLKEEGSGR